MISLFKSLFNFLVTIIKASNGGSRRYLTAQQQKMLKRISYLLSMSMLFLFFSHFLFFIFLDFTDLNLYCLIPPPVFIKPTPNFSVVPT